MSNVLELIGEIEHRGGALSLAGTALKYRGPEDALTDNLLEQLRTHRAELLTLMEDKAYWTRLAGTKADPNDAWEHEDIIFLTACEALREADSEEHLLARWNGLKQWLCRNLSEAAMLALFDLFFSLKEAAPKPGGQIK